MGEMLLGPLKKGRLIVYFYVCSSSLPYDSVKKSYVFPEKHVRLFKKNTYVFFENDNRLFKMLVSKLFMYSMSFAYLLYGIV